MPADLTDIIEVRGDSIIFKPLANFDYPELGTEEEVIAIESLPITFKKNFILGGILPKEALNQKIK